MKDFRIVIGDNERVAAWVCAKNSHEQKLGFYTAVSVQRFDGTISVGVLFDNFNRANINMHVAAEPGAFWPKALFWLVFDYAFNQLKVKRVSGLVPASNLAARKFDEWVGFQLEATLTDAHPTGDLLVYKMTKENCRWLKRKPAGID